MVIDNNETIAAISTPPGIGGIGIIKISGRNALTIGRSIFRRSGGVDPFDQRENSNEHPFKPFVLLLGNILNPENEQIVDEVLLTFMQGPKSYTGEDVVEIQAHSGPVVLRSILELILEKGARLAEPGEFTKRAFLNGRIDLTQAEAIDEIIHAKTKKSLEVAVDQVEGSLGGIIRELIGFLNHVLSTLEVEIDFSEEIEGDDLDQGDLTATIEDVIIKIEGLIKEYEEGAILRDGLKLCIAGKPNVGKSSLMNSLLRRDRAIVTPIPGTTRDAIEEVIDIDGLPVIIMDTAGIHESEDTVETMGMKKAWEYIHDADIIIFMMDASTGIDRDDEIIFDKINEKKIIIVANKRHTDYRHRNDRDTAGRFRGSDSELRVAHRCYRREGHRHLRKWGSGYLLTPCRRRILADAPCPHELPVQRYRRRSSGAQSPRSHGESTRTNGVDTRDHRHT